MIQRLPSDSFDAWRWRNCDVFTKFNFACRKDEIIAHKHLFLKLAVGFLEGENLVCRPKVNTIAVMLLDNDEFSWFHMTRNEFVAIFGAI